MLIFCHCSNYNGHNFLIVTIKKATMAKNKHCSLFISILTMFCLKSLLSNHVGTLIRSLSNCTKAQGTLLDLHGPPNGPLNGPSEANFWGPLVKKGPAGSLHGPNWSIFLDRSLANVQTWIYSLVWGQSEIRFPEQSRISERGWWLRPPPALIRVKWTSSHCLHTVHQREELSFLPAYISCVGW